MSRLFRAAALFALALHVLPAAAQVAPATGRVVDAATAEPIPGATLLATGSTVGTSTDRDGRFALVLPDSPASVVVSFVGYRSETVTLTAGADREVALTAATTDLQPVVVSASRSARTRAETPAAVSSISAADLRATRPNLLAEALNRAPGVLMVDLGNEQHAMSIRQPISYKPLFLYLEDGVALRPAGLFNHNALIEVNMAGAERIEIVRGPGSALYGAGAVGGAVNVVTESAATTSPASASLRGGPSGYGRFDVAASARVGGTDLAGGAYASRQRDGLREHSDYDKVSLTARADRTIAHGTALTATATFNSLTTDTDGSLDSTSFFGGGVTSLQTFTSREVRAARGALRLDREWSPAQRTTVTAFGRANRVGQNPHYRLRIDGDDPTQATGEVNDNAFRSLGLQAQHEARLGPVRLLGGGLVDRSPASYVATFTRVTREADTGVFTGFTDTDSLLTDYDVTVLNTAVFAQLEVEPVERLRVVAGLRADRVGYALDNALQPGAFSGAADRSDAFAAWTPRVGVVYAVTPERGLYANASRGFVPPEAGELYRGVQVPTLTSASFDAVEAGGFARFLDGRLALDGALYRLDGRDEIVTARLADGSRVDRNAGRTRHEGVELGVVVQPNAVVSLRVGGTAARHEYIEFVVDEREGRETRYDGNEMERAPGVVVNAELAVTPPQVRGLRLAAEVQRVGPYWMDPQNTVRYDGHAVVNLRAQYAGRALRGAELWATLQNVADVRYATTAAVSFGRQQYAPGLPRALTLGVGWRLGREAAR